MNTAIHGSFIVFPLGGSFVPKQTAIKPGHQLETIEEIDSTQRSGATFQQHKAFFERKQCFVNAQVHRIGIMATERIFAAMIEVIITVYSPRTQAHQRRSPSHKRTERIIGTAIFQEFRIMFIVHLAETHVHHGTFKVNALAGINFAIAEIHSNAKSKFRQMPRTAF